MDFFRELSYSAPILSSTVGDTAQALITKLLLNNFFITQTAVRGCKAYELHNKYAD